MNYRRQSAHVSVSFRLRSRLRQRIFPETNLRSATARLCCRVIADASGLKQDGKVLVGTASWSDTGFVEFWYPKKMRPADRLSWYAQHFNMVEVNSHLLFRARPDAGASMVRRRRHRQNHWPDSLSAFPGPLRPYPLRGLSQREAWRAVCSFSCTGLLPPSFENNHSAGPHTRA